MLKIVRDKWDKNKELLRNELINGTNFNDCSYLDLVKLAFDYIYNSDETHSKKLNVSDITEIDNGDYQGTLIYLIPFNTYQPDECQYLMTYVGYGSCSACDTLQEIQAWGRGALTEQQVSNFMILCKDILTNTIKPYNHGWRNDGRFDQIKGVEE